jgi:putative inorganic carbon (HCO3(-)) transporter
MRLASAKGLLAPSAAWLAAPIVLAVAGLAAVSPMLALVLALGVIVVAVTLSNLVWGVALLTFLTFLEGVPGLDGVVIAKPLGLVLVFSWALTIVSSGDSVPFLPRDHGLLTALLVSFTGLGCVSAAWALDSGAAISASIRLITVVALVLVVYSAVRTPRDLRLVASAFVAGTFTVTVISLANGNSIAGRLSAGGAFDPNYLAAVLVAAIALAAFMLSGALPGERLALIVALGTFGVALILTGSRGGLVAAAVVLVVGVFAAGPLRGRAVAIGLIVIAAGLAYYLVLLPPELRDRVSNVSTTSSSGRTDEWQIALHMAGDHPIVGVGIGNYPISQIAYVTSQINLQKVDYVRNEGLIAHNTYLEVLAEMGIVGLSLLVAIMGYALVQGWRAIGVATTRSGRTTAIMRGLFVGMVGLMTAYVFLSGQYQKRLWLLLGLLVALPNVARAARAATTSADEGR